VAVVLQATVGFRGESGHRADLLGDVR